MVLQVKMKEFFVIRDLNLQSENCLNSTVLNIMAMLVKENSPEENENRSKGLCLTFACLSESSFELLFF